MILIIPLGGIGSRFRECNYMLPKPLINVMGRPMIYWLIDNLNLTNIESVIIPYNKELSKYNFEDRLKKDYPNINFLFIELQENTRGASETLLIALNTLDTKHTADQPIICLDGDNFYTTDILSQWNGSNCVFLFKDLSNEEIFSYAKIENGIIVDIKEKSKISNNASTGTYGFSSWHNLKKNCQYIIDNNIRQKNEFYTSTVIKIMIENGEQFFPKFVDINNYICLGTPLHIRLFCNNYPKISSINRKEMFKQQRYCFDLDNTLVTFPKVKGDYTTVEPITHNIEFLKYLKKFNQIIIIYTARRMRTANGNIGKCLADIGKITFETLEKFDIPYDEIYFGKPYADYYIDDLAISAFDDLEKALGFYRNSIDPREYNNLNLSSVETFKKESYDLSGEIYYYNNIPTEIKDMFPFMFSYDSIGAKWYEMEKINGIPVSKLYVSGELSVGQLECIMTSIRRIQGCKIPSSNNDLNIYANYLEKIKERYNKYPSIYKKLEGSNKIYEQLCEKAKYYEENKLGKLSVIHGDPVLTNIIINNFGKIKFIDMRGKLGDDLTICGDWLYDWAKLYQSLIGYDEILMDKYLPVAQKILIINFFMEQFKQFYGEEKIDNLKLICNLHLFTLIPLHTNQDHIKKFYELISL